MKEKIFNNFSLKILSVLCAIVLWAVIVNIYDPTTSVTISNVNVELINAQSLTDKDYTYEVVDGSKISVYLSGPKSVITDIKSSDIVATADLSKISAFADYVDIDVKVVKDGKEVTGIEVTPRTTAVKLDIENRLTKEYTIETDTEGMPADGYVLTSVSVTPTTVKVTGPSSIVENIDNTAVILNGILIFEITLIPYFTLWLTQDAYSIASETTFGLLFIAINITYNMAVKAVHKSDPYNDKLIKADYDNLYALIPLAVILIGFGLSYSVFIPGIYISCLIAVIMWIVIARIHRKGVENGKWKI